MLLLRDDAGRALAEATLSRGSPSYAGDGAVDCRAQEASGGDAWKGCFEAQSRWVAQWATRVATARVRVGACTIDSVPVLRRDYSDSIWLWWLPLPHVGGRPYGYYALEMHVDSARCAPATLTVP